ncbi:MAG: hypothetical protein K2N05_10180 [Muribaculaceae bacterium]|nr:hypothetical protein [Muribaculaceae bacterium]
MKSIYFWIVAAIMGLGLLPAAAQDKVQFTINVPIPEGVECTVNWQPYELVEGANHFEVDKYTSVAVKGVSPYSLNKVIDSNGTTVSGFSSGQWYFTANDEVDGKEFTLEIIDINEYRTSSFTINVDDPSLVQAMVGGYYEVLKLKEGENIIKYDPAVETYITIQSTTWGIPLYSVKKNGVNVELQGSSYMLTLEEDCVIDIVAKIPDGDATVTFKYSRGGEGAITGVKVNNEPVEDFDGNSLVVKLGQVLEFSGNTNIYKYDQVTINGTPISFWSAYSFNVMADTEIFVDAHPYGNIKAKVVVPNPDLVTVYKGYSSSPESVVLTMQPGENEVELPENNPTISWVVADNAIFNEKSLNGIALGTYETSAMLKEGDVLVLDAVEKVYDKQAVIWIDNKDAATCNSYVELYSNTDRSGRYTFEDNGYGFLSFYDQMNPFSLGWYGYDENIPNVFSNGRAYLNDQPLEPTYPGGSNFSFNLKNNDVLKLFMDGEPDILDVNFDIAPGIQAQVIKDIVTVVEDPSEGFECFPGTQVSVTAGDKVVLTVNGEAVEAEKNDEGESVFTFVVDDNTIVTLAKESTEGLIPSTMKVITTGGTPMVDEPMFSGLGISPNGKYVCGMINYGGGYFITDLENDDTQYEMSDMEDTELHHIDNNGLAIGYDFETGITYSLDGGRSELAAPEGVKYILGEDLSNRGRIMVGTFVENGYETFAAYAEDGVWARLPEPTEEEAGMYYGDGSAAKFVSGDGKVILGYMGNFGPACLWVKNETGEYVIDPVGATYSNITDDEIDNETKDLYNLIPIAISNNGKYAAMRGEILTDEGSVYVPVVYDVEEKTIKVYKDFENVDLNGWGLTPTTIANDGSFAGIIGGSLVMQASGSFYWPAGEEKPMTFSEAFSGFAERYSFFDMMGYATPTGMSANGRYIVGYAYYAANLEEEEPYFETYVIDTDPDGAPEPDDKNDDVSAVGEISISVPAAAGIYTIDGIRIEKLQKGINIIRKADGSVVKVMK